MDFGTAVTGVAYKLVADDGSLGSEVTAGIVNIGSLDGKYLAADVDTGDNVGVYWYCDTVGVNAFALFEPTVLEIADALLNRNMSEVDDTNSRSPLNALRFLRNKWSLSGSTLTVTKENDSTSAWTAAVSTDAAAEPITGSDPA